MTIDLDTRPFFRDTGFMEVTTERAVLQQLRRACKAAGSLRAWARENDFSHSFVVNVLAGRRDVTTRLAARLGFERMGGWRRKR